MREAAALKAPNRRFSFKPLLLVRASLPTYAEVSLAIASALLLILSFPDFDLWWLAWIGLVPLLIVIAQAANAGRAFVLGWLWGIIFFYGSCWWLTYPMVHYAHVGRWLAYPLLLLPVALVALFPALACGAVARIVLRYGRAAVLVMPLIWVSCEWLRYAVTGQLWNAIGYSQAFHPLMIQTARWGGVYLVSFLILTANVGITWLFIDPRRRVLLLIPIIAILEVTAIVRFASYPRMGTDSFETGAIIIAVQPNVPMEPVDAPEEQALLDRHISLSEQTLNEFKNRFIDPDYRPFGHENLNTPRLIIWPESPMNFSYSRDPKLRETVAAFTRKNHTSILLNSLEATGTGGEHNSALLINEEGRIVAQYDKIRLMPFGEYVPLPHWLPGASSVRGIVGEFTPGSSYTLMPLGAIRAGVFICIEAAHPGIARSFTDGGADVLVNISNDGYLGRTPVMRQHLANAVFRAVENDRPLLRVTNTGISALIERTGEIRDTTMPFQPAVRSWIVVAGGDSKTFYTRHGDVFVYACALIGLGILSASFMTKRRVSEARA